MPPLRSRARRAWVNGRLTAALLVAVTLGVPRSAGGQEPDRAPPGAGAYAKTPDTVIPYRNFGKPYARFFQTVTKFRGAGRDDSPEHGPSTVRVGFLGPIDETPDGALGRAMLGGVQLAIKQANEDGGYEGLPFELIVRADKGLWGATSDEMVAFSFVDNVLAVIGSVDGANTHIALRVALKTGVPMVNTATTDPTLTETNIPWIVRCMADDRQQGYALAFHIFSDCGLRRVVALRVNDRFGRTGMAEFRDAVRRLKSPLLAELRWERGDTDFTKQLDRVAETDAQAVVLWGDAADTAAVVREIRRRERAGTFTRQPVRIFGCDRLASRTFLEAAGEGAEGVVVVATCDMTRPEPALMAFKDSYHAQFGREPDSFAAHAYDGANMLLTAIRRAGLNRIGIRDALYDGKRYDGVTGTIELDTTMNDVGPVYIATVSGGRFVFRAARFAQATRALPAPTAYRSLARSPPVARSPGRLGTDSVLPVGCFLPLDATGQAVIRGVRGVLSDAAAQHPDRSPVELLVEDVSGTWGENTAALASLVSEHNVVALIGSTERRGTHLAEMLAAKFHFPVLSLCEDDSTITQIPLPWVFSLASPGDCVGDGEAESPEGRRRRFEALGRDAGALVVAGVRAGARSRLALRDRLATGGWMDGASGTFRFDVLGNRVDRAGRLPGALRKAEEVRSPLGVGGGSNPPKTDVRGCKTGADSLYCVIK